MPRNGSGTYSLPAGNPVVAGDVIEAAWANTTLADVANELTNSLSRNGNGGMLAPFRVADGSVSAPGLGFTNETNTGLYRAGSGEIWLTVGGIAVAQVTVNGLLIPAGKRITLPAPVNTTDATNKEYVDDLVAPVIGYADFYLGPKSSDPLVNNSGGALTAGTTYWSTTLDQMRVYNGINWVPMPTISSLVGQTFSGTGAQTAFTLANPTGNAINLEVFISGVRQVPTTDYSVSGTTLTFVAAPPSGTANIFVRYAQLGTITDGAGSIVYTPAGTGAVATTVQTKLRETVSVLDFGADPTGVADSTTAIQAAINAAKNLYFPPGTYLVDTVAINNKGYVLTGSGTATTTIKAKAASTKLLQILGISTWATENVVKNMTLDISLMSDVSTNVALYHGYSWGCLFENIIVTGNGTNKLSYFADLPGAGNGVYTSTFTNVNFGSTTGKVKLLGVSTGNAITTLLFNNCAFGQFDANNVMDITLMMPVVQGNLNKFLLSNTLGFSVMGGDIEGTSGTCYVFGASVNHLMSLNNELASFSGTYTSGTVVSCIMQDFGRPFLLKKNDQGMTFNDIPITFTNDTVDFTDAQTSYTKTGASLFRTQFNASNASAQQVDLQLTSAVGSAYIGQTSTGKAFVDSRGSGGVALQVGGTDKVGVDTTDRLIASTASKTTVGAAGGASALPATPSGYLRIMRGATEFVIPYYAA